MNKQILILALLVGSFSLAQEQSKNQTKEKTIEEVTLKKTKKAVEHKADRTIFDFSEQPNLNTGTALEGIKKLPGLMSSELTGMNYQGKSLAVYMDSRPLNITSTDLNAFLEGLPASSIDRIEVITNPGAEFPATGGGAILNIITSRSAKNYLTATYTGNYSFSNEEKVRSKTNQSILLNAKNKWFGWQLNAGANYRESIDNLMVDDISDLKIDGQNRGYFARTAFSFDLGKDKLLLHYNINHNNNDNNNASTGVFSGLNYQRKDQVQNQAWRHEAVATYQKRFDDADKKLDFRLSHHRSKRDFGQETNYFLVNQVATNAQPYANSSDSKTSEFTINYSQNLNLLEQGKISMGGLYERMDYDTEANGLQNLDYYRNTYATFAEVQATKGKWDFTLGMRAEGYDMGGETYNPTSAVYESLKNFKKFRFFPNASVQYNLNPMVNMALNYNHKIELPYVGQLNPNTEFTNGSLYNVGNAHIQPTLFHNIGAKISAFNYFFISYDLSLLKDEILNIMSRSGDVVVMGTQNLSSLKAHNIAMGLPLPLAIFTKPIKEIMQSNPDKMSFLYFVGAYNFRDLPDMKDRGLFYFNVNGQIMLPKAIKLGVNYTIIPKGAEYYYFRLTESMQNALNLTLSKKFLKDRLNISLFANDIFNTNQLNVVTRQIPSIKFYQKQDSRTFGITLNYKIPTKNRLAKENQNMLLESESEEKGGLIK